MPFHRSPNASPRQTTPTSTDDCPTTINNDCHNPASECSSVPDFSSTPENYKKRKFDGPVEDNDALDKNTFSAFTQESEKRFEDLLLKLNSIIDQNRDLKGSVEVISNKNDEFLTRISVLEGERKEDKKLICQLEEKIESLERKSRSSTIEVQNGTPKSDESEEGLSDTNYVRHLLFVEQPKRKTTAECIDELRKSVDMLNSNFTSLRSEMTTNAQQSALRSQLDNIKSEVASVKAIMLNRNQFPALKTRPGPPSIPDWQRQSEEATSTEVAAEDKKKAHRSRSQRSESGGSNSSEGEQATKNSDSSLEIMKQYPAPSTRRDPIPCPDDPPLSIPDWQLKSGATSTQAPPDFKKYSSIRDIFKSDKPRRPMKAYMMWLHTNKEQFKAENPGLKVTELAARMSAIWKNMDKSEWEEKEAKAKEQYEKEMALYNAANGGSED